jgi:hypothetical protein
MDYHKKYIKYKEKYIELKNKMHGGIDKSVDTTTIEDFLKHLYLVSSQDEWNLSIDKDQLIFADKKRNDTESILIDINPFLHPYPTLHTTWGTLVYPHSSGSWEFSKIAVIVKASQYKDKIYKLNPYDTMLLMDNFVIDKNVDVVIAQSKLQILTHEIREILKKKANSITTYDDSPKDEYTDLLTPPNLSLAKFVDEYKKNYNTYFGKQVDIDIDIYTEIGTILRLISDKDFGFGIKSLSSGDSNNSVVAGLFLSTDYGTTNVDPYIFAKTYFKTCLRDAIDKKIETMQQTKPETNHINVQIYCNSVDKKKRLHNPVCYREIKSGQPNTNLLTDYSGNVDYKFLGNVDPSNNTPMIGESSILGPHSSSLLDNRKNVVTDFVTLTITEIIDKQILNISDASQKIMKLNEQYNNLITRGILPVSFKSSTFKSILLALAKKEFNTQVNKKVNAKLLDVELLKNDIEVATLSNPSSQKIQEKFIEFKGLIESHA